MAAVRVVKPEATNLEFFQKLLKLVTPPKEARALAVEIIMDTYLNESCKSSTRRKRGKESTRVHITGLGQKMPHGNGWISLLNNDENKTYLIKLFVTFMKSDEVKQWLTIPFVVTEKDLTWRIDRGVVTELFLCNHEEADSRMVVLRASLEDVKIVVCSKDTDVLLSFA